MSANVAPAVLPIVVGVDGSPESKVALRWAKLLGDATGATIDAVSVWQAANVPLSWAWISNYDGPDQARARLGTIAHEVFGEATPPGMRFLVKEGSVAKVLLEASKSASTLVVGSRGLGGFTGLLLGSVSAACVEHASCPVLVVHGEDDADSAR